MAALYVKDFTKDELLREYPFINKRFSDINEYKLQQWMNCMIRYYPYDRGDDFLLAVHGEVHSAIISKDYEIALEVYTWLQNILGDTPPGTPHMRKPLKTQLRWLEDKFPLLKGCRYEENWNHRYANPDFAKAHNQKKQQT